MQWESAIPRPLAGEAESPAWICGRLDETIWMSSTAMNMPTTMAKKPNNCRGVGPGWAGVFTARFRR